MAPGVTTDEIDRVVHEFLVDHDAYPSTLGYKGFPKSCCTSLNEVICHGIPDSTVIQDGDIVNIDVTAYIGGVHGDTNATFLAGDVAEEDRLLVERTREATMRAIKAVRPGRELNVVGRVIESYASASATAWCATSPATASVARFHSGLVVLHYDEPSVQTVLEPGMTFTIEPMITLAGIDYEIWRDDWTVVTKDRARTAQWEHTVVVTADGAEILTRPTTRQERPMAKCTTASTPKMATWVEAQPVFFVATAPLADDGLVNLRPKGTPAGRSASWTSTTVRLPGACTAAASDDRAPAGERPDLRDALRGYTPAALRLRHRPRCIAGDTRIRRRPAELGEATGGRERDAAVHPRGDRRRRRPRLGLLRLRSVPYMELVEERGSTLDAVWQSRDDGRADTPATTTRRTSQASTACPACRRSEGLTASGSRPSTAQHEPAHERVPLPGPAQHRVPGAAHLPVLDAVGDLGRPPGVGDATAGGSVRMSRSPGRSGPSARPAGPPVARPRPGGERAHRHDTWRAGRLERGAPAHRVPDQHDRDPGMAGRPSSPGLRGRAPARTAVAVARSNLDAARRAATARATRAACGGRPRLVAGAARLVSVPPAGDPVAWAPADGLETRTARADGYTGRRSWPARRRACNGW